jgi:outer membrane protein assembly factor BamB
LTADNQLIALRQSTGDMVWSHRGINEIAGRLHMSPPAVRDGTVVAAYSSGEIFALELDNGNPAWNDNLAGSGPGSADPATFSTVSPIMATGLSFAGSSSVLTAFETDNGSRLWERKIPTSTAPWLAGNYLFVLTSDAEIAAVRGMDGAITWTKKLPAESGDKPQWFGPVVAGSHVWIVNNQGQLLALSPQTGKTIQTLDVPEGILSAPIIAGETMYLIDQEAKLTIVK